jgi:hypothetical protein
MPHRALAAIVVAGLLAACGRDVPPVPPEARDQQPQGAPTRTWLGKGRITVDVLGRRLSARGIVRSLPDGQSRMAILSDEGLLLLDLRTIPPTADGTWYVVESRVDAVKDAEPHLARLLLHAIGHPVEGPHAWDDGVLVAPTRWGDRLYGGDPVMLHRVEGDGLDLLIGDWRPLPDGSLVPHSMRLQGPLGLDVHLHLTEAAPAP